MNIGIMLIMVIYGIIGGVSTLAMVFGILGTIVWKIKRKITQNIPLTQ